MTLADGTRTRLLFDYRQSRELLMSDVFSRAAASAGRGQRSLTLQHSVTEMDRPQHTRIRRLLAGSYAARGVERLRDSVEAIAAGLAGDLLAAGPPADLVERFCAPLTFAAQCELLGVPDRHRRRLRRWVVARSEASTSSAEEVRAAEAYLHRGVGEVLRELRSTPGASLLHGLIEACDTHAVIDEEELHGIATSMFRDGHFLAATQIANSMLYLLDRPGLLAMLKQRPELIVPATEELLRLCPAINHSMSRVAIADTTLCGLAVPAGATFTASLPAANRDGSRFEYPHEFDLDRPANRHLSFGHGIHYCLGAHLTRVEIHTALRTLLERLPGLRLSAPTSRVQHVVTQGAVGVRELPVTW